MRDKEQKHRNGQETTIGKIIYGFLLFMPLIAIGVTCGYAMFNKNAYQSYSGKEEVEKQLIDVTELDVRSEYNLEITNRYQLFYNNLSYLNINEINNIGVIGNTSQDNTLKNNIDLIRKIQFMNNGTTNPYLSFRDSSNEIILNISTANTNTVYLDFTITGYEFTDSSIIGYIHKIEYNDNYYLSNVFYYAVDKVTESPLFNWAQNSLIYNTTNATCNTLSITAPFIPLLLSYWLIISIIYFLYDIALMLVWLIHRKIHELQESL